MSRAARDWAYAQPLKAPAKPVLVALAEHGERCWPSVARLAEMTGYDVRTVRRAIRTLEQAGLIDVEQQPGKSASYSLKLSTTPVRESARSESHPGQSDRGPRSESPGRAVRESGDPGQSDRLTVKNRNRTGKEPKNEAVIDLPDWMPRQTWDDFVEQRRKMKAPMTDIAQRRAVKKLAAMHAEGQDIEAVIEQSIVNGWKGLFPVKGPGKRNTSDKFSNSVTALQSLFGEEHGQADIPGTDGLSSGGLLEGDHERDGGGLLGPAWRAAG